MKWTPGAIAELLIIGLIVLAVAGEPRMFHALIGESADQQLLEAAIQGNPGAIEDALGNGADPNATDSSGNTPLIHAVLSRQLPSVKRLLDSGADPNAVNALGMTPLMLAAQVNDVAVIHVLLARGADPQRQSPQYHLTALQFAQRSLAPEAVAALRPGATSRR
jgi:ankyrin repeat protein